MSDNQELVPLSTTSTDYGPIAWFYDRHWGHGYHPWAVQIIDELLLSRLPKQAQVLDLCCGNGVVSSALAERGCRVTGIDTAEEMLSYARLRSPDSRFLCADARDFHLPAQFNGALCTFDGVNHILSSDDLRAVFYNVYQSLHPGGWFLFDLVLEEAFQTAWQNTCATVDDDYACFIRGGYESADRLGHIEVTLFRRCEHWDRADVTISYRCHPLRLVKSLLREAGFSTLQVYDSRQDLGLEGDFGQGRAVVLAAKPHNGHRQVSPSGT